MSEEHDERAILEGIAFSDDATYTDRMRALELLRSLDKNREAREFYSDLDEMTPEQLDEIDAAFGYTPVYTLEQRAEERAREILADDEQFNAEVQRVAKQMAAAERREERRKQREAQNAQDAAEDAARPESRAEPSQRASDAPSAPAMHSLDEANVIALKRWDDSPHKPGIRSGARSRRLGR